MNIYYQMNTYNQVAQIHQMGQLNQMNHLNQPKLENMIIEESKDRENFYSARKDARSKSKDKIAASNRMLEEVTTGILKPNALLLDMPPRNYLSNQSNNLSTAHPQQSNAPLLNNLSTNHKMYNSNGSNSSQGSLLHNTSNISGNRSFTNLSENEKKPIVKSASSNNSNHNSNIKTKSVLPKSGNGNQKYSDQKTESTYISGGDSPSPLLDCDESLTNNFSNNKNLRHDNCLWVEKFELEFNKISDPLEAINTLKTNNREILQDITGTIMKIEPSLSIDEELAQFNQENNTCAIDTETISYLIMREIDYSPDPHYFEKKQPNITWIMRAILLDWMMEVCMEFTLKRETFHYAVNYVDRYLSIVGTIQKWELQLIGVASLYIAAKMEVTFFKFLEKLIPK